MFESILKGYMENESNDKITTILSKIKAELIKHFSSEEYLLSEKKYSKLEEHKNRCYSTYKDLILDRRLTLSLSNRIMDLTHEEPYAKQRHSRII